jgi:hypothetical protein
MSHHLDSSLAREDSRLDLTDLFLFPGEQGLTMVMNLNSSAHGDRRKPGFHPQGRYEFKVHLDGAPYEEFTFRFTIDPTGTVRLHQLIGDEARRDEFPGNVLAQGRIGSTVDGRNGERIYTGEVFDPFYLDLRQLALIHAAVQRGQRADLSQWLAQPAVNSFDGATVWSIVLELPSEGPFPRHQDIAVWSVAKLATDGSGWRQINRAGIPMLGPIFRPDGRDEASARNEIHPSQDGAVDGKRMAELIAGVAGAYGTADPDAYGEMLAGRLLPDLLPYHVGTAAGLTFAGFNGRLLDDNAPEVMFSLVANAAIPSRISPRSAAGTRQPLFPYVVPTGSTV